MTTELIEALEKAEEPSRELDYRIFEAIYDTSDVYFIRHPESQEITHYARKGVTQLTPLPEYTASIDAALTLVPKGMRWGVGVSACNSYVAQIWYDDEYEFLAEVIATSPALALSAAALRARENDNER